MLRLREMFRQEAGGDDPAKRADLHRAHHRLRPRARA